MRPSTGSSSSRCGSRPASLNQRGLIATSVRRPGAWSARDLAVRDPLCVPERALGRDVDGVRDNENLIAGHACRANSRSPRSEAPCDLAVVPVDAEKHEHEQRDGDGHHPCPCGELRPDHDECDDERRESPDPVDQCSPAPARVFGAQPVPHHAGLGEGESGEHADHIEMDESLDVGVVDPDQPGGDGSQGDDAVGEHKAVAEIRELSWEEAVPREQRSEPREALVGGVRGEDQDGDGRGLDCVVHEAAGRAGREHDAGDLRDE